MKLIKFLLTQKHTKSSNFKMESGESPHTSCSTSECAAEPRRSSVRKTSNMLTVLNVIKRLTKDFSRILLVKISL